MYADNLRFVDEIPDVIWGDIQITEVEHQVIQEVLSPRLKEIKQMGVAWVHFTGAIHNRFQHSLGAMHAAFKMLSIVKVKKKDKGDEVLLGDFLENIDPHGIQILRLAALLHDVGHPPFSHLVEEGFRKYAELLPAGKQLNKYPFIKALVSKGKYSHESATQYLVSQPDVQGILTQKLPGDAVGKLTKLMRGETPDIETKIIRHLIDGDLDVDKMDYLLRDSYFCGLKPKFSIEDFKGRITILEESERICIGPDDINTANSFIFARHRLIDEVQHEKKGRIATQLLIEDLMQAISSMKLDERARFIEKMHLDFADHDLERFLADKNLDNNVTAIKKGIVNWDEVYDINFFYLDPVLRSRLFTLMKDAGNIKLLQERIRNAVGIDPLIVDIRMIKEPKFSVTVTEEQKPRATIFDRSLIARGILDDSIKSTKIHFYAPSTFDIEETRQKLESKLTEIFDGIQFLGTQESLKSFKNKRPIGIDLLLLLLKAVREATTECIDIREPWIYSEFFLQTYLAKICAELSINTDYKDLHKEFCDVDFIKDMRAMTTMGLIQQRERVVSVPTGKGSSKKYEARFDYALSEFGNCLANDLLKHTVVKRFYGDLFDWVLLRQDGCKIHIKAFIESELEIIAARPKGILKDLAPLQARRKDLRIKIKEGNGCLIVP